MSSVQHIPLRRFIPSDEDAIAFEIAPLQTLPSMVFDPVPDRHTFYVIHWVVQGTGTHLIDWKNYAIQANTFYCIAPGQVHSLKTDSPMEGYALLFMEEFLQSPPPSKNILSEVDFFSHIDVEKKSVISIKNDFVSEIQSLLDKLFEEFRNAQFGRITMLQSLLTVLLVEMQRHYAIASSIAVDPNVKSPAACKLTAQFRQLIGQHYKTQQTVQSYAEMLRVTSGHLTETVKLATGFSAGELIRQRIVLEAKRMLTYTNNTVREISSHLNFRDAAYFSRFFKRETGQTPAQFRNNFRKKYNHYLQ